jgi:HTH-type transcriptional repressor of puuD
MKGPTKGFERTTSEIVSANLAELMRQHGLSQNRLSKLTGVSQSHISAILRGDKQTTVDVLDRLGKPFGLKGWHLSSPLTLSDAAKVNQVIEHYAAASPEGRELIARTAEREARISKLDAPPDD